MEEKDSNIVLEEQVEEVKAEEVQAEEVSTENVKPGKKKAIWRRKYLHECSPENDIKFRGKVSYRHLRIIAWVTLAIGQIGTILTFGEKINNAAGYYGQWPLILGFFTSFLAPLFLIAAFSTVLNAKDGYRRLLILYGGLSLLVFIAFLIVYEHFIVGLFKTAGVAPNLVDYTFVLFGTKGGTLAFNIFLDLLLCTLITFFINYRPSKFFQGKKIYIFRAFAALPILYEIGAVLLKVFASVGMVVLHPLLFPLLTTKPPLAFLIFIVMAIYIKNRERIFLKRGKTHEDFIRFQDTNVNSLQFSITLSVTIAVVAILDVLAMVGILLLLLGNINLPQGTEEAYVAYQFANVAEWGFGKCVPIILIIPLIIFYDYRKTYPKSMIDTIISIGGIALLAIVYIEGGFEVLKGTLAEAFKPSPEDPDPIEAIKNATVLLKKK